MAVHHAREQVRDVIAPLGAVRLQLQHVLLDEFDDRQRTVLRILEEVQQLFREAVARAAAHAVDGHVKVVHAVPAALDRVREGELLVVVAMEARLLALHRVDVLLRHLGNLLGAEVTKGVDEVEDVGGRGGDHADALVEILARHLGDRHQVAGHLVALRLRILDHVDRERDLMDVAGHADDVHDAVLLRQDVRLVVAAARIGHHGDLQRRLVLAHDGAKVLLRRELPLAEVRDLEHVLGGPVAELHVVHARREIRPIEVTHELVREPEIVHETAIAHRRVEDLDVRTVVHHVPILHFHRLRTFRRRADTTADGPSVHRLLGTLGNQPGSSIGLRTGDSPRRTEVSDTTGRHTPSFRNFSNRFISFRSHCERKYTILPRGREAEIATGSTNHSPRHVLHCNGHGAA